MGVDGQAPAHDGRTEAPVKLGPVTTLLYAYGRRRFTLEALNAQIAGLNPAQRNAYLERELLAGHAATPRAAFVPLTTTVAGRTITFHVAPDWLGLGAPGAILRATLPAQSLQRVALAYQCELPTNLIVDLIHAQGLVRVPFRAWRSQAERWGVGMDSSRVLIAANDALEASIAGRAGLVTDAKKDVIVGASILRERAKVMIYGGWDSSGSRIQPASTVHSITYSDYSQCGRLIARDVLVDGRRSSLDAVIADPVLYRAVSSTRLDHWPRYA